MNKDKSANYISLSFEQIKSYLSKADSNALSNIKITVSKQNRAPIEVRLGELLAYVGDNASDSLYSFTCTESVHNKLSNDNRVVLSTKNVMTAGAPKKGDLILKERLTFVEQEMDSPSRELNSDFLEKVNRLSQVSDKEKISLLKNDSATAIQIARKKECGDQEVSEIAEISESAMLTNLTLLNSKKVEKEFLNDLKDISRSIEKSVLTVLETNPFLQNNFQNLANYSSGSLLGHIQRVHGLAIGFSIFYNSLFQKTDPIGKKVFFNSVDNGYRTFYSGLLNNKISEETDLIDIVFEGGMKKISENDLIWLGLSALLHDIGKGQYLAYFEGGEGFNEAIVKQHPAEGVRLLSSFQMYPDMVAMVAGMHHEYNGKGRCYSAYPSFGNRIRLLSEKKITTAMGYDSLSFSTIQKNGSKVSLAYFPAKILEIVDIFDALTDSSRLYSKEKINVNNSAEILEFMEMDQINKNLKLDKFLFDLFCFYLYHLNRISEDFIRARPRLIQIAELFPSSIKKMHASLFK